MRIPKGSRICLNGYAIQHDPNRHVDADRFVPERYEGDHTSVIQSVNSPDARNRDHFAFGAGRRICPGYNVAERSLAVAIMRILWAFEIKPAGDAKLPLNIADWRGAMPGTPGPTMPVTMVPLNERKVELIQKAHNHAVLQRPGIVSGFSKAFSVSTSLTLQLGATRCKVVAISHMRMSRRHSQALRLYHTIRLSRQA